MWKQLLTQPNLKLENSRAIITHLTLDHLDPLSLIGLDPRIWVYNPAYNCDTKDKLKVYIEDAVKCKKDFTRIQFAVFDKKFNKYGGSTAFYNISEANKKVAFGYTWFGVDFQRTGLNAACKSILYDLAFNTMGVIINQFGYLIHLLINNKKCNRVEFHTDALNIASRSQILHYGCQFEGIIRQDRIKHDGVIRDTAQFSILSNEYAQQKHRLHIE